MDNNNKENYPQLLDVFYNSPNSQQHVVHIFHTSTTFGNIVQYSSGDVL